MNSSFLFACRKVSLGVFCTALLLGSYGIAHAAGWVELTSPTTSIVLGMDCASSESCIAVGVGGSISRTADAKHGLLCLLG